MIQSSTSQGPNVIAFRLSVIQMYVVPNPDEFGLNAPTHQLQLHQQKSRAWRNPQQQHLNLL